MESASRPAVSKACSALGLVVWAMVGAAATAVTVAMAMTKATSRHRRLIRLTSNRKASPTIMATEPVARPMRTTMGSAAGIDLTAWTISSAACTLRSAASS